MRKRFTARNVSSAISATKSSPEKITSLHTCKLFRCSLRGGGLIFFSRFNLPRMGSHVKPMPCATCGVICAGIFGLREHKSKFHKPALVKKIPCQDCGKLLKSQVDLDCHRAKMHSELVCTVCQKVCQGIEGLKSHCKCVMSSRLKKDLILVSNT